MEEENRLALVGPGGFRFIWKPAQSNCRPHLAHVSTRAPQCGKWPFSQIDVELLTGPTQWPGHTGSLGGSVGLGTTALGFPENGAAAHIGGRFPLGCPPRERGAPPRHSVPRPTPPRSETCACSPSTQRRHPRRCPAWGLTCRNLGVRFLGWCSGGDFPPNRVRKVANMSLFWGSGLLYTRGWGLRPGGVLVGSLTCCRSYSCGGGSVPCLAVCRWALLVGVSLLGKKACVFVQIEESVVTVFDCTWACKEAEQQAQWQQGGAW